MKDEPVILLVEDNPDDVELALRGLKRGNLLNEVVVVNDGEAALDYLSARGEYSSRDPEQMPALVLLDLKLPKVNGIEVLEQMRAQPATKLLPVVVLTTSDEQIDLERCYELGCNSYICKPVDFKQFAEVVEQLQLYWLVLNRPPPKRNV